jgi:hypothetical protein
VAVATVVAAKKVVAVEEAAEVEVEAAKKAAVEDAVDEQTVD